MRGEGNRHGEFEVALAGGGGEGGVIADDALADHEDRFADHGVDLAGHDGGAGLDGGEFDFAEAGAGAGAHPADVVGDFGEGDGEGFERGVGQDGGCPALLARDSDYWLL